MAARFGHAIGMGPVPVAAGDVEPDWRTQAACRGSIDDGVWFPDKKSLAKIGKRICVECPIKDECLVYALEKGIQWGIWGGMDPWELRKNGDRLRQQLGITPI